MSTLMKMLSIADRRIWLPLERFNKSIRASEYNAKKNARAMETLRSLESQNGKVSPNVIKACDDYAVEVFGSKGYAPSLYVYSAFAGEFKEGWIPGNYYDLVVVPVTSGDFGDLSELKSLGGQLIGSRQFPDIARLIQGVFYDEEFGVIPVQSLPDKLFSRSDKVVFKLDNSNKGKAVHVFRRDDFDPRKALRLGNGVFQYFVDQHEELRALSPTAVATLRMTTAVDRNGTASVRACYLRVGRTNDPTIKASSQVRIVVDPRDGSFARWAFLPDNRRIETHPDSGIAFEGGSFPHYGKCVETVTELHRRVPFVSCVGWDVCVDSDNEPKVLEWNGRHNAIGFGEAVQGPCFRGFGWEDLWRRNGRTPVAA
jgi:hypothetical protein